MFAITPSDIEYHIKECCCCSILARIMPGTTRQRLERAIKERHGLPIAA